ncbi:hypothetical protein BLL42_07275 [Pseudomonas frederiksbergensis]|uniref:Lipoprotein n=1 Tax=Pseudomonas frederiksbergensis TaxID=104087 RepID=A0A1J0EHL4_9PSED|nr:hypothetical protein [Pseudomonas frederiksbergensis]APC15537.1 hypothetical protein BLL42_07275 [Pseudomonas frederiksbergensis]
MTLKYSWLGCVAMSGALGATQAYAECGTPPLPEGVPGYSVCKDWPAYDGQTITALSQIEPDPTLTDEPAGTGMYDLKLAVVSNVDGKPLARYSKASVFSSDAFRFDGLSIDTARYKLTSDLRAFGVRAGFTGSSRANPFDEAWLSLYVREGNTLRPVLEQLVIESGSGEWDTNCAGEFSRTKRTLDMAKTSSHGFADLIVKSVTTGSLNTVKNGECEYNDTVGKTVLTTLRYDGRQYVVPKEMQGS